MRKFLLAVALALAACMSAGAQAPQQRDDRQEAINVADRLFEALRTKNAEAIRALFIPEGQLVAIDRPRTGEGPSKTRVFTSEAFGKLIAESKAPGFNERMPQPQVEIFGDLVSFL